MLQGSDSYFKHGIQNLALMNLSILFLPFDTFILIWSLILSYVFHSRVENRRAAARNKSSFQPKTVLVTGVGMTKGLAIARNFYEAGHDVIGADFEVSGTLVCGRVSKSLQEFVPLSKPSAKDGPHLYIQGLLDIIKNRGVDLWVSCSGVASAVEDGQAKEIIEARTKCKAIQFDVNMTQTLHEKHTFIAYTQEIGLTVPETHTIINRAAVDAALRDAPKDRQYIMKPIGMDDSHRGDMTLLPKQTPEETSKHLSKIKISEKAAFILQQYIKGREFCTHSIIVKGRVKAFVACPSAELLMHYEAIPPESKLSREMLKFTQTYAKAGGESFTGHLSFDFFVEDAQLTDLYTNPEAEITLYPIECNPRAHTAVALFNGTPAMADAYLSLLDSSSLSTSSSSSSSYVEVAANRNGNGTTNDHIVTPAHLSTRYFWIGHDLTTLLILPLLSLITLQPDSSFLAIGQGIDTSLDRLLFWKDGTYEVWDPLPWWWLYHVYWPWQFILSVWMGKKWSRINVSTCKMFEC